MGRLSRKYDYGDVVSASVRVAWKLDDLLPPDTTLSFERPHLPEVLTAEGEIGCLAPSERLALNHIRGHSYMNLFAFVEEYIIAQAVNHAQAEMFGDHDALRALLRFGEEELKHQQLFYRYRAFFDRDFPTACEVLESASEVAGVILGHSSLAVMLTTLHIELMTQQHYVDCVRNAGDIDPLFGKILKHHWVEEAQHAKIDILEVDRMRDDLTGEAVEGAVDEYFGILEDFDGLLRQQVDMDLESLGRATGRALPAAERDDVRRSQLRSNRRDFLVTGMTNPLFKQVLGGLHADSLPRLESAAAEYVA